MYLCTMLRDRSYQKKKIKCGRLGNYAQCDPWLDDTMTNKLKPIIIIKPSTIQLDEGTNLPFFFGSILHSPTP